MMMNQMMGMSMMMNNPLAMMSMGAPMMAHQMPMMAGMKLKKDDKTKKAKLEDKTLKREPREAERVLRKEKDADPRVTLPAGQLAIKDSRDPRVNKPVGKDAMI